MPRVRWSVGRSGPHADWLLAHILYRESGRLQRGNDFLSGERSVNRRALGTGFPHLRQHE